MQAQKSAETHDVVIIGTGAAGGMAAWNLTRQGLVNAVDKDGAKWTGPGLVPFRYGGSEHGGYSGVEIGQVRNGKIVLFGGPLTTEPTASSAITPYSGQQPAPPAGGVPSN